MTHVRAAKKTPGGFSLEVDFSIPAGLTALYGPPGAGKSLLLGIIAGVDAPDSGRILLEDAILFDAEAGVNLPARRRGIGYVFQTDALFPHLTLERNVAFAARAWPRLERHRRVADMLEIFELASAAGLHPRAATAEQKLRCAVARALVREPRLLLIDDAGVDEPLLNCIRGVYQNPMLLVTRGLDLALAAGELILIAEGRIVQHGNPRAVLDAPDSVEAAKLLGIPNVFSGSIAALDPGRGSSRLEFEGFSLAGPYLPGHLRGDRVSIAVRPEALRVHSGKTAGGENFVAAQLLRVSARERYVRLEFAGGIFADIALEQYAALKNNQEWQVEFPAESLRVL